MTDTTVSDARLDEYASDDSILYNHHEFGVQEVKDIISMAREIQSFRALPEEPGVTEQMLIDAFMRGASWRRRNGIPEGADMVYEPKAARDYADATLTAALTKQEGSATLSDTGGRP